PAMDLAIAVPEVRDVITGVRLSFEGAGGVVLGTDGRKQVDVGRIDDPNDGARVVMSGGGVVYERTRALPRVRWMPRAAVITAVPAGRHVIDVTYHATGQHKGFIVSFLALLALVAIGAGPFIRRRVELSRAAVAPSGSGTE